ILKERVKLDDFLQDQLKALQMEDAANPVQFITELAFLCFTRSLYSKVVVGLYNINKKHSAVVEKKDLNTNCV
ncbi:MAG TPA: hypothetical protein VJ824_08860, partial [Bacillota bacterium]|nr:hypothetical protein [Bacillota bacterium]